MATYEDLIAAARKADEAGETDDARRLLEMAVALRGQSPPPPPPIVAVEPEAAPMSAGRAAYDNPTGLAGVLRAVRDPLHRFNRSFSNGYTFNAMDEIEGAADAAMTDATYGEAVQETRTQAAADAAERPIISAIGNILGGASQSANIAKGLGLTPAATMGGRITQGAGVGGLEGALYGAGSGEGVSDRVSDAAIGAGFGAAVGMVAPVVIEGARRAWNAAGNPIAALGSSPNQINASRAVQAAMNRSGRSADDIAAEISRARALGQPYTIADATGYSGQRMLAGAARTPGDGRQQIIDYLINRQSGQGRRVGVALDEALNAPRNPGNLPVVADAPIPGDFVGKTAKQVESSLTAARGQAADAAYTAAREGAGPIDVRGALAAIDDRIGPMQGSGVKGDGIDARLSGYRARLAAQPPGPRFAGADAVELSDFDRVLGVKQAIQDDIGAAVRAGRNNEARELGKVVSLLDQGLEQASPNYRAARNQFRKSSQAIGQIEAGSAATSPRQRAADTVGTYSRLPADQQATFRVGYADPLLAKIEGAAPGVNKVRPLLDDATQQELDAMARNPADLTDFLRREDQMFRTANAASGGSMTADNLADQKDVAGMGANAVVNLLSGRFGAAAQQIGGALMDSMAGRNEATRREIARLLLSDDVAGALSPALQRGLGNASRSGVVEALIRSGQRGLGN